VKFSEDIESFDWYRAEEEVLEEGSLKICLEDLMK